MKYLLFLLVLMAVVFISGVRKGRADVSARERTDGAGTPRRAATPAQPTEPADPAAALMVACASCGTHLPLAEALPGRGGHFCCAEHRARHEARQGHG